ncbi:hypothetical protein CN681_31650 [Bacillus toyonensis]|uniref:hypothetical protein n=1 Tax=Bacillus toyonensis TaxID=155322 RepID=UPI000BF07D5A|nr:hypothetical protein CN681_31650 [Bacillus toyonensis]PGA50229.1 hypothetical protein COL86_30290 [Bacillus toyonensis]PGB93740.1 hypothetical protein COM19_27360 [Bacillus toyonensis]
MYANAPKFLEELLLESAPTLLKEMHWHFNYISYCIVSSNSFLETDYFIQFKILYLVDYSYF